MLPRSQQQLESTKSPTAAGIRGACNSAAAGAPALRVGKQGQRNAGTSQPGLCQRCRAPMAAGCFGFCQQPVPGAELAPRAQTKRCIEGQAAHGQKVFLQEWWKWENAGEGLSPSCGAQEKRVPKLRLKKSYPRRREDCEASSVPRQVLVEEGG